LNALEASGVVKRYERNGKSLPIVEIAEFAVREGEFITVIGPSGCGKSTFLHIMGGFIKAESGSIRVSGKAPAWRWKMRPCWRRNLLPVLTWEFP